MLFQYMGSVQSLVQVKLRSSSDDNFSVGNKILKDVFQSQNLGLNAVHQRAMTLKWKVFSKSVYL